MSDTQSASQPVSEAESRRVAEAARETEWKAPSFLKELFYGNFRLEHIYPFPLVSDKQRPEFKVFYDKLKAFIENDLDPIEIDTTGEYPPAAIKALAEMGAFGMKIPTDYGGLGLTQVEYNQVMELLGAVEPNLVALLSAHQSIGVPQPIKMFGSPEQKKKYLPRCAKGAISAFALTEPDVGSDPAKLATTAELTPEGDAYVINGTKLWCTNGTIAELMVVMARHPNNKKISAFVVEADTPGITIEHRCRFMGLKAIANALISFKNVRVPKENLIGAEGAGLKIALVTLNTGRLSLPAASTGTAKNCLQICREWTSKRVQWGVPIGKHEAVGHMLADMAATTFAMESVTQLASQMADRGSHDIRLEAAAAKEWNTCEGWKILDTTLQIRGGRGYETESSLEGRGEKPIGVERMLRDFRINKIFEGSSEIMHLFMAREAVDNHLKVAGAMVDPTKKGGDKLKALPKIALHYAKWYPLLFIGKGRWPFWGEFGKLAKHVRFIERSARKLARQTFHGMIVHQAKLERKQGFLFRIVDIGLELFAMAATVSRAQTMKEQGLADADQALALADIFCRGSRRKVQQYFSALWWNHDAAKYQLGQDVMKGAHTWMEESLVHPKRLEAPAAEVPAAAAPAPQPPALPPKAKPAETSPGAVV